MENYLDEVKIGCVNKNNATGERFATVRAYHSSTGTAEVDFTNPARNLSEDELIELLRLCRKARKMYAAADKLKLD